MKNLFRKLLEKEFGESQYHRMAKQMLQEPEDNFLNMTLTWELAERLRRKRLLELRCMRERLEDTLLCSYRISRGYWPYAAFCLFAALLLFFLLRLSAPAASPWRASLPATGFVRRSM